MLKPDRIAGAGGLRSRHDAMLAAKTGADYVMFGEARSPRAWARRRSAPVEERREWWAELLEMPCIGYAASADEVGRWRRPAPISSRSVNGYGREQGGARSGGGGEPKFSPRRSP